MTPVVQDIERGDETIDRVLAEIDAAIQVLPDPDDEAIPRKRAAIVARRRQLEQTQGAISLSRQIVVKNAQQVRRHEAELEVARPMIASFERALALPAVRGGMDEVRDGAVRDAYRGALAWMRDGQGDGATVPGACLAYVNEHHLARVPPSLPTIMRLLASARADLADAQRRLDAALASWQAERPPAA